MTDLRTAAQQALEAIDRALPHAPHRGEFDALADVADALRAALAEPQSTHSAECYQWHHRCAVAEVTRLRAALAQQAEPLYTAPPQRKPLTDDEIEQAHRHIYRRLPYEFDHSTPSWVEQGIRYAEWAHGIGETNGD